MFNNRKLATKKSQSCLSDMDAAGEKRKFEEKRKSMAEEKTLKNKNNKRIWTQISFLYFRSSFNQ